MAATPDQGVPSASRHRGWNSRGYLPHFDGTVTQALTLHLGDSLPTEALARMRLEVERLPETRQNQERRRLIEEYADVGHGSCILQVPAIARMVQEALLCFHAQRYTLRAWVVMPNHIHVLFRPIHGWSLLKIVASWKKFTARRICQYCRETATRERCVPLPVWHPEFWDRYMRDDRHFQQSRSYIHRNPVKAGLVQSPEDWPWSSAHPRNATLLSRI